MGMGETNKNCTIYWIEIYLAPIVQNVDNAIHRINVYPLNSAILIHWIVIYPVDSGIQLLKNWAKVDSTIQPWNNRGKCVRNSRKNNLKAVFYLLEMFVYIQLIVTWLRLSWQCTIQATLH